MSVAIPKSMEFAYRELYKSIKRAVSNKENKQPSLLSSFFPMKGTEYDNASIKLMLVGRSTNGWKPFDFMKKSEEDFLNEAKSAITCTDGFSQWLYPNGWAKERIIRTIGTLKKVAEISEEVYLSLQDIVSFKQNLEKVGLKIHQWRMSPFFYSTKSLLEDLCRAEDISLNNTKSWFENIVWTNICPISPVDEGNANAGNATGLLKDIQLPICTKLLAEQIEYFNPTHVLFITGWCDWFEYLAPLFGNSIENMQINNSGVKRPSDLNCIEAKGIWNNRKIVVTIRPERRMKTDDKGMTVLKKYDADVREAFASLK